MAKKILTLDALAKFCEERKLYRFNSSESGYQLCVAVPAKFEQEDKQESSLLMTTVKIFHTGENRNRSSVTEEAAKNCLSSIAYKPILANFTQDVDGNYDFTSHDIEINDDGELEYIEKQVGCFTADKPYMEEDAENPEKKFIVARAAIPREYTRAAEIIERKGGTKVSAELAINKMSYSAENKILILEDIELLGCTLLGIDPDSGDEVQEGMKGARLDIEDFSLENNSNILERIQRLEEVFELYRNKTEEGGNPVDAEIKDMTTEEVEDTALLSEVEETDESEVVAEPVEEETENVEIVDEDPATEGPSEPEDTEEPIATEGDVDETIVVDDEEKKKRVNHSVEFNGMTKTYAVSLQDKIYALTSLVNETYGDDGSWYDVTVYDDDKYVIMVDWWQGKAWKQAYKTKKDNYSLVGDRVEVFSQWLTQDEIKKLEDLRANYAEASEKLAKYEAEPEKMQILESEDYSSIVDVEEFVTLKTQEAHFDMSVDEVRAEADKILLNAAKTGKVDFSAKDATEKTNATFVPLITSGKSKSGRYGGIFKK